MKKMITVAIAVCLVMAASAQKGRIGGARVIVVSPSVGFGYSPWYYSPFGYYAMGYPYGYGYGYNNRNMSKLDRQVQDLKLDYDDKIHSAKNDKSLSKDERRKIVKDLKAERDKAVHDLKANYYKQPRSSANPGAKDQLQKDDAS